MMRKALSEEEGQNEIRRRIYDIANELDLICT